MIRVIWTDLLDRQLQTATGAKFTVVRVTATHVAVRPQRGRRDYALSISRELEPAVAVYAARNLPAPADLRHLGVRPVLTSYAWGILKAVAQDRIGVRAVKGGQDVSSQAQPDDAPALAGFTWSDRGQP
jgi:hypothetical protein